MRIAFDIGGVISRFPVQMKTIMQALIAGGIDVCILTDMCQEDALRHLTDNGFDFIPPEKVFCAKWAAHGDRCKSIEVWYNEIDVLVDDRLDYMTDDYMRPFIGLMLAPRPKQPYYAPGWVGGESAMAFVPREDYEAFRRWEKANQEELDGVNLAFVPRDEEGAF